MKLSKQELYLLLDAIEFKFEDENLSAFRFKQLNDLKRKIWKFTKTLKILNNRPTNSTTLNVKHQTDTETQ